MPPRKNLRKWWRWIWVMEVGFCTCLDLYRTKIHGSISITSIRPSLGPDPLSVYLPDSMPRFAPTQNYSLLCYVLNFHFSVVCVRVRVIHLQKKLNSLLKFKVHDFCECCKSDKKSACFARIINANLVRDELNRAYCLLCVWLRISSFFLLGCRCCLLFVNTLLV